MKKPEPWKLSSTIMVLLAIVILTPGFYRNQWQAAGRKWFYDWRTIQEHLVVARLVQSRQSGPFSHGALLGFGNITDWNFTSQLLELEYQTYLNNGKFQSYFAYTSNPGVQGVFFSLFQQSTHFPPNFNLKLFHGAISLLTALVLGLFIHWVIGEMGWLAGFSTLLFVAFSEWMTLFGGNMYWNLWAFYLPFIMASYYLMKTSVSGNYNQSTLSILLAGTMLIKCLFTGFEYITTALIMPLVPFAFYAIRDSWEWPKIVARSIQSSVGLLAGVAGGLLILIWQILQIKPGLGEAVATILNALGKRTFGDPSKYGFEAESLRADLWPVMIQYINGRAVSLTQILHIKNFSVEVSYLALFILFITFTLLLLTLITSNPSTDRAVGYAIIVTTWVSAAAPLSWFILFKAHSYIHTQMNFIIWQMPFTLYGFALCGYTIGLMIKLLSSNKILRFDKALHRTN